MALKQLTAMLPTEAKLSQALQNVVELIVVLVLVTVLIDYGRMLWMRRKLPPGPFPFPIVGNHFQTPRVRPWIAWEKWSQYYNSPMMTLWIGRHPRIILSDAWVASDLLEKRSDIFSSRPHLIGMGDAVNFTTTNQTTLPYGDRWRLHRRLTHAVAGSQVTRNYRPFQEDESKILTRDFLTDPDDFVLSIERYSVSVVSIIGWGRRINDKNDPVAQLALKLMEAVDLIIPGLYLMEAIPALLKLPSWLYKLPSLLRLSAAITCRYFCLLTEEGEKAKQDNFAKLVMKSREKYGLSDPEVALLMGNLVGGGVDTTSSTTISCVLAMACFPDVQEKAQAELDAVVGRNQSLTWDHIDENQLPYLVALVKEVLRWRTVTILAGIPHANTKDVEYKGYHFPAGTNFTGNMWAIHRNPRDFPEPDEFRPERFLNNQLERPYPNARGSNPFGWGRRICSGMILAEQGLLSSLGRMIWAFKILPGLNDQGNPVKLDVFAYTDSENMRPEPFKVRFVPRSESIHRLILSEAEEARKRLKIYDAETKVTMEDAMKNPAFN